MSFLTLGPYASVRNLSDHHSPDAYLHHFVLRDSSVRNGESRFGEGALVVICASAGTAVRGVDSGEDVCDDVIVNKFLTT